MSRKSVRNVKANQNLSFSSQVFIPAMQSIGNTLTQHPSLVGGGTVFLIVFLFITANALWYQNGVHPAPILDMRGPQNLASSSTRSIIRSALPVPETQRIAEVKTFEIERSDNIQTATVQLSQSSEAMSVPTPVVTRELSKKIQSAENKILLIDIQTWLAGKNLYSEEVDGLMGPKTEAAIRSYQENHDLDIDGKPSEILLRHMRAQATRQDVASLNDQSDVDFDDLVRQIQIGLSQSAYPHIEVDGLVGVQTQEAILQFEKHYRLPQTGVPNQRVLEKLTKIGAFN